MKEFNINKEYENIKIENLILKKFPNISTGTLNKLFRVKDVKINDIRVSKGSIVHCGDNVKIYLKDELLLGIKENIDIYYEDNNLLICYKPKGICSCNTFKKDNISFEDIVRKIKQNDNIKICHRLDTNTEGLVIFSKNNIVNEELLNGFKNSMIHKEYLTLVKGKMEKENDILNAYILKDTKTSFCKVVPTVIPNCLNISTEYSVISYFPKSDTSLLKIKLHTGRTHQIRAHMKYIGHNVIGDSKYGLNDINRALGFKSQILVAYSYSFSFSENSLLSYLNDITVKVKDEKIQNILKWIN